MHRHNIKDYTYHRSNVCLELSHPGYASTFGLDVIFSLARKYFTSDGADIISILTSLDARAQPGMQMFLQRSAQYTGILFKGRQFSIFIDYIRGPLKGT